MTLPESFTETHLYIPAAYWPALGYTGQAQFVATYFGAGDEAYYDNGREGGTGYWAAYNLLLNYPPNYIRLGERRWWLGSSEEMATHWLVCDRESGRSWLAPVNEAVQFLNQQWPRQPQVQLTKAEWDELQENLLQALANAPQPTAEQIRQAMAEQAARLDILKAALRVN